MHESAVEARGRWVVAAVGAIAIVTILLLLFRVPTPVTALSRPYISSTPKAQMQIARTEETDVLLRTEAELRDLRPLFLPTERNAALSEPRLEPGRTFLRAEMLKPTFSDTDAQISKALPGVVQMGGKPMLEATVGDVFSPQEQRLTMEGFGRGAATVEPLDPRGGYVEVISMKDGRRIFEREIPISGKPAVEKAWAPLELIGVVDAAGLVSPLVVTDSSRVDEVDAHFRTYLAQTFRIGERLPPGFYRITVAP